MALPHAILASLLNGPMTGYDLAKQFNTSGFFWRATHQQIYLELGKLEKQGMLEEVAEEAQLRLDRVPRRITEAGRAYLLEWVDSPSEPASIKEDVLVKCLTLGLASPDQLHDQIARKKAQHAERLSAYRGFAQTRFANPKSLQGSELGRYIALRAGILYETQWVEWAAEALELLKE